MKDRLKKLINKLNARGAAYADIRLHLNDQAESFSTLNGELQSYHQSKKQGYGIRVLADGAWGFASSENIEELELIGLQALENAYKASLFIQQKIDLADKDVLNDSYSTPSRIDPFTLPGNQKIEQLLKLDNKLYHEKVLYRGVRACFYKRDILFVDTEGSEIEKNLLDVDASMFVEAIDDQGHKQRRSYSLYQQNNGTVGFENIINAIQFDPTQRLIKELLELLEAPNCEQEVCDVILLPEMMALQTHETIGHALELDRILGYELSYAGGSHIDLEHFGQLQFGSSKLNARADGTVNNSPGSTGFDDDGVRAKNILMIEQGMLKNAISSRQMIVEANNKAQREVFASSAAANRAESYHHLPIERMNNINIDYGEDGTLEDIIAKTQNGLLLETPKSWSIGSNRENFHFATEVAWKIKNGRISHMVKNATYQGDSLQFWHSLDQVGDKSTWQMQQVFNCGKGQPNQIMRMGHGVPICRFKNVQVGL
ncbi:MAG: TldD/PmbA family protein [Pseudomonadota bacterium]